MTKIQKLRELAASCEGVATTAADDEWSFPRIRAFLDWLDAVEGAGLERPADFNCSNSEQVGWANDFTKDEEI